MLRRTLPTISLWMSLLFVSSVLGQFEPGDFQLVPELQQLGAGGGIDHGLSISARIRTAPNGKVGLLEVTAKMNPGWHVYSLTQGSGGPTRSQIKLKPSPDYQLLGSFSPDRPPHEKFDAEIFKMQIEDFSGQITWSVPIQFTDGRPSAQLAISGFVEGQVCADGGACVPFAEQEASFTAVAGPALSAAEATALLGQRFERTHTPIRVWSSQATASPGDAMQLHVAFNPDPQWHVYAYETLPESVFQRPTLVQTKLPAGWKSGAVKSAAPIVSEASPIPDDPPIRYYDGPVTLSMGIQVPATTKPGTYPISGQVAYQTCSVQCDMPTAIAWQGSITVAAAADNAIGTITISPEPVEYDDVVNLLKAGGATANSADGSEPTTDAGQSEDSSASNQVAVADLDQLNVEGSDAPERSLVMVLGLAFAGGFILNFMPCVLPVIGLKIMSFVDQAGASRLRVFGLNSWYALGMLSVFWVLAALAAAPALGLSDSGFGWGQQFNYQGFAIPLVCLVFAMALSFLGVWEIPIPGFATGGKASELTEQEGYSGAFFKGAITTVLATPCIAPGLPAAYGWAVQSGSALMIFLVFTVMGLGMAIPYLIIGAFPALIRFLPKPGAWMDTFKQVLGFVLLGTVIFLLQNVAWPFLLPTIAMMFGIWFACWWVGRVPLTAEANQRRRAWAVAAVIILLAATFSFGRRVDAFGRSFRGIRGWAERKFTLEVDRLIGERINGEQRPAVPESENELPWEPFQLGLLNELRGSQTTVMIDFTADW